MARLFHNYCIVLRVLPLLRDSLNRFMGLHIPPPPPPSVRTPSMHNSQLEAATTTTIILIRTLNHHHHTITSQSQTKLRCILLCYVSNIRNVCDAKYVMFQIFETYAMLYYVSNIRNVCDVILCFEYSKRMRCYIMFRIFER
jgi:hypothetical protein